MTTHCKPRRPEGGKGMERMGMPEPMRSSEVRDRAPFARALLVFLSIGAFCAASVLAAPRKAPKQERFATPEAALQALRTAVKEADHGKLAAIFGPDREQLMSGDAVADANALKEFSADLDEYAAVEKVNDSTYTLIVGKEHWPSPIPIVKDGKKWRFDTAAGIQEISNRRIGENELSTIATCRAYVMAQWEYYTEPKDASKDGLAVYAQKFISTPGGRDGLYWEVPAGGQPSPMGSLVAQAQEEGYQMGVAKSGDAPERSPYHGYFYKILDAQGPYAPGGKFSYVINGNMIAGYALIAYPAKWGSSGVMTFIVNQQGRVYEKNLGSDTATLAAAITEYDPDPSWTLVEAQ
jgi:Protein of unknown function (DUF2950)